MIDATNATTYFSAGCHPGSHIWATFSSKQQEGAIAQARRILSRAMGRAIDDNEAAYAEGDTTRDEFAVYEQALHILVNTVFPNAEGSGPQFLGVDPGEQSEVRRADPNAIAPEAQRWLGVSYPRLILARG
jgi:hypothetical protein